MGGEETLRCWHWGWRLGDNCLYSCVLKCALMLLVLSGNESEKSEHWDLP